MPTGPQGQKRPADLVGCVHGNAAGAQPAGDLQEAKFNLTHYPAGSVSRYL